MDYSYGLGMMPYLPTNNAWSSPYMMNPMLFNPMFQYQPQLLQAPEFSSPRTIPQTDTAAATAASQQAPQQLPDMNIHDIANAGDVLPMTMQSVEKHANLYRRSDEFGKLLIDEWKGTETGFDGKIIELDSKSHALKTLEKRIADAKAAKDTKLVSELERTLASEQRSFDISAKSLQKDLLNAKNEELKQIEAAISAKKAAISSSNPNPRFGKIGGYLKRIFKGRKGKVPTSAPVDKAAVDALKSEVESLTKTQTALKGNIKGIKSTGNWAKWGGRAGWLVTIGLEAWDISKVANKHGWTSKQTAKKTTSAAAGTAAAWAGAKYGAIGGAKLGAAIGTFFGGPAGTGIGAGIGAVVGGLVGGAVAYWGATKISDWAFDATMGKTEYKA